MKINRLCYVLFVIFVLLLPVVSSDLTRYFSIVENEGPYDVLPGGAIDVEFTLMNEALVDPNNVTVSFDPCPVGWSCEKRVFSFDEVDRHPVSLRLELPETALPKRYTLYLRLESESQTKRGDDRLTIDVLSEIDAKTVSYEDYLEKERALESEELIETHEDSVGFDEVPSDPEIRVEEEETPAGESIASDDDVLTGDVVAIPAVSDDVIALDSEVVKEGVENLESSSQFVEYASVVLFLVLVFVAMGAYVSFKKGE